MQITLTSKRQATFPVEVCRSMEIVPGSRLEIIPGSQSGEWIIRTFRIQSQKLAPLKGKLKRGAGSFDLNRFRESSKDYASLRD